MAVAGATTAIVDAGKNPLIDPELWKNYASTPRKNWPADAKKSYEKYIGQWREYKGRLGFHKWPADALASWNEFLKANKGRTDLYLEWFWSPGWNSGDMLPPFIRSQWGLWINIVNAQNEKKHEGGLNNVTNALKDFGSALIAPVKNSLDPKNLFNPKNAIKQSLQDAGKVLSTADAVINSTNVLSHAEQKMNTRAIKHGHFLGKVLGRTGEYARTKPIETVGIVYGVTSIVNSLGSSVSSAAGSDTAGNVTSDAAADVPEMTPPTDAPPAPDLMSTLKTYLGYASSGASAYKTLKALTAGKTKPATGAPASTALQSTAPAAGSLHNIFYLIGQELRKIVSHPAAAHAAA